jgi:hypothetical protein
MGLLRGVVVGLMELLQDALETMLLVMAVVLQ